MVEGEFFRCSTLDSGCVLESVFVNLTVDPRGEVDIELAVHNATLLLNAVLAELTHV